MKTLIIITITLFLLLIGIVVYFLTKKINNNLECKNNCSNNGICDTNIGLCKCNKGFIGDDCSNKNCVNGCYKEGGTCNSKTGICECKPGYNTPDCSKMTCPNDCNGHGNCNTSIGKCMCNSPYEGDDCSEKSCSNPCGIHGYCDPIKGGYCICKPNVIGLTCDKCLYDLYDIRNII